MKEELQLIEGVLNEFNERGYKAIELSISYELIDEVIKPRIVVKVER
jgi:hypothetical protein